MRNKILIVGANLHKDGDFENMLQDVVEAGGELFFAEKTEDGLSILKKEKPQLVFLDAHLIGADHKLWLCQGVHIVLMRHKHEPDFGIQDCIFKPIRYRQVLERCLAVLDPEPAPPMPPM